jgi:pSer/pThr/pTyr-binding forkhead associated (FHA) protein
MNEHPDQGNTGATVAQEDMKLRGTGVLIKKGLLVVVSDNLFGSCFVVDRPNILIGRSSDCHIVIQDPLVSREHCRITIDADGNFHIQDLDSKNSTYLNKKPLKKKRQLFYGDRMLLGDTILRFFLEEEVVKK